MDLTGFARGARCLLIEHGVSQLLRRHRLSEILDLRTPLALERLRLFTVRLGHPKMAPQTDNQNWGPELVRIWKQIVRKLLNPYPQNVETGLKEHQDGARSDNNINGDDDQADADKR